jgi:hypothetical protein
MGITETPADADYHRCESPLHRAVKALSVTLGIS